jgi:hypothetical protein
MRPDEMYTVVMLLAVTGLVLACLLATSGGVW